MDSKKATESVTKLEGMSFAKNYNAEYFEIR